MFKVKRNWQIRDDDTLFEMMRMYNNLLPLFTPIFDEMSRNFDFTVATLQWDKAVREKLRAERRPANSYNLIRTIFNMIYSIERDNRRQGVCRPRTSGDAELANVLTQTLNYFLYQAGSKEVRTKVKMDAAIAKYGVRGIGWNFANDPEGTLELFACDPREFMFEPNYADKTWSKAKCLMRKHQLDVGDILNQFALNDTEMQDAILSEASLFFNQDPNRGKWVTRRLKALFSAVYQVASGSSSSFDPNASNYMQWWDPTTGKFDVLEFHEQRTERRLLIPDRDGVKLLDISEQTKKEDGFNFDNEKISMVKQVYQLMGEPRVDLADRRFMTAVIPAFRIKSNEQVYPFDAPYYMYLPQYCYDWHADMLKTQSVMDDLIDPQSHFNKSQSLKLELLGRYANKGWIMDENAISGLEEDWMNNRIAPFKRVRAGYINMIRPEEGQTISPDLVRDPIETEGLMKTITNINDEIRGADNTQVKSGKHFIAKERQQSKSLSYMLENGDTADKAELDMDVRFIQHFVQEKRIIRITKDMGAKEEYELTLNQPTFAYDEGTGMIVKKITHDLDAVKFDIELSDEPYSSSAQEERQQKLGDMFNAAAEIDPRKADAMLPIMAEELSIPRYDEIIQKWEALDQPTPEQAQLAQIAQQIEMIMAKLGVAEKQEEVTGKKLDNIEKGQRIKQQAKENVLGTLLGSQPGNGKKQKPQPTRN